ncbi:MAG: TGS domain-containing protein, partial [Pseudomonadales bacterium]|nr:TGS domain-containing protein [Pseudomonadales bacterium]
ETSIQARLLQENLKGIVFGREKHLYSIYLKMKSQRKQFVDIMDVFAFRIVTETVDECYRVLGSIHNLYKPVHGRFKDYIAIPKGNGYQSLHTELFGAKDITIEVQIRTREMDAVAMQGIAEHSYYKGNGSSDIAVSSFNRARKWVQDMLEMQKRAGDSMEFIDNVKKDLFPDEVYVFTPKGRIYELPPGATAVDFAYAIHTDVGNSCISCRVNRRLVPLSEPLESGQTVEIIRTPSAKPNMAWLNFVVTGKARSSIRHFLKNQQRDESVQMGRRLLNQFLSQFGINTDQVEAAKMENLLLEANLKSVDELLQDIGVGNRMAYVVARKLKPDTGVLETKLSQKTLAIEGTEGVVIQYAKCCQPIPGDSIVGYISSGRGFVVHRSNCKNIKSMKDDPEKCIFLEWSDDLEVASERGIVAHLATTAAANGANILKIDLGEKEGLLYSVNMELGVRGRIHLARTIKKLRALRTVNRVVRI